LSHVDHIWIVAPIVRAVDDQSAKESLGEALMAKLLRDRMHGSVDFIMTKTDGIVVEDALRSLKIDKQKFKTIMFDKQRVRGDLESATKQAAESKGRSCS
jgi:hypothetical protein